jgi:hypothetical protein
MLLNPDLLLKVPIGQGFTTKSEEPNGQKNPGGQMLLAKEPVPLGQKNPDGHTLQLELPGISWYVPLGQLIGTLMDMFTFLMTWSLRRQKWPGGHKIGDMVPEGQ